MMPYERLLKFRFTYTLSHIIPIHIRHGNYSTNKLLIHQFSVSFRFKFSQIFQEPSLFGRWAGAVLVVHNAPLADL